MNFLMTCVYLKKLKNKNKIKLDFRYEFWFIHSQFFGTMTHSSRKFDLSKPLIHRTQIPLLFCSRS